MAMTSREHWNILVWSVCVYGDVSISWSQSSPRLCQVRWLRHCKGIRVHQGPALMTSAKLIHHLHSFSWQSAYFLHPPFVKRLGWLAHHWLTSRKTCLCRRYRTSRNDSYPGESCLSCLVIFGLKFRRTMLEPWQRAELGKRPWTFVCAPYTLHGCSAVILRSGLHTTSARRSLRTVAEPNGREASQYFKRPKPASLQHSTWKRERFGLFGLIKMAELLKFATCTCTTTYMCFFLIFVVYWFEGFGLLSHTFEMRSGMSFTCPPQSAKLSLTSTRIGLTTLPVTSGVWVLFSTRLAWSF